MTFSHEFDWSSLHFLEITLQIWKKPPSPTKGNAKDELKGLMPEDAKEAFGHGVRAKRSKAGAVSFEAIEAEVSDAPVE